MEAAELEGIAIQEAKYPQFLNTLKMQYANKLPYISKLNEEAYQNGQLTDIEVARTPKTHYVRANKGIWHLINDVIATKANINTVNDPNLS